jgi:hypothetical protein
MRDKRQKGFSSFGAVHTEAVQWWCCRKEIIRRGGGTDRMYVVAT